MSAKDKNPTINRFVQLTADLPSFAGMRRSGNPASLPPFLFRDLENIAMRGNDLVERGGQEKYNPDTPLDDCGDGFLPPDEEPDPFGQRLLVQASNEGDETDLRVFSSGISQIASVLANPASLTYIPGAGLGGSGGRLFWAAIASSDLNGPLIQEFSLDASDSEAIVGASETVSDVGVGGEAAHFDSQDFIVTNVFGVGLRVTEDPFSSAPVAELTNASPPDNAQGPWLKEFDSKLCVPISPTVIARRSTGSAGWDSSATLPALSQANLYRPSSAALFDGDLYFTGVAGGFYALFRLTTAGSVSLANIVTSLVVPDLLSSYQPVCVHNGVLWLADAIGLAYWTADGTIVEFTPTLFTSGVTRQIISFRGRLWLLRENELWSSRFPHSPDSWIRASLLPDAFGYAVLHPIL